MEHAESVTLRLCYLNVLIVHSQDILEAHYIDKSKQTAIDQVIAIDDAELAAR